jgi:hypothetical protein
MRYLSNWSGRVRRVWCGMLGMAAGLGACSDISSLPNIPVQRMVVVVNSESVSLTLVPLGSTDIRTLGLGAEGTPTTLAVRGHRAVVPMGDINTALVVDLRIPRVEFTVPLPAGSGATGVAFLNDTIALVANPNLNSVSPVNVLRGTAGAPIAVGVYPQAIAVTGGRAYVVNANLSTTTWQPIGPGSVTVVDPGLTVSGTVQLTGINPGSAAVRNRELFVLNSGTWGGGNSSLSVVDLPTLQEIRTVPQMGNFPGSVATLAGQPVFVAAYSTGLLVYEPDTRTVVRSASNPLTPGDLLPLSAVQMDDLGLLYTLHPGDCTQPGRLQQVTASGGVIGQAEVGVCPFALAITQLSGD